MSRIWTPPRKIWTPSRRLQRGFFGLPAGLGLGKAPGGDPNFGTVILLMHFDNTLLDSSSLANTFSATGSAAVSTSSPMVGTGSLLLDGAGDYISAPDVPSYNIGNVDFTMEWKYRPTGTTNAYDTFINQSQSGTVLWKFDAGAGGNKPRFVAVNTSIVAEYNVTSAITLTAGVDYSMAWVRSGATVYFFLDGVSQPLSISTPISTNSLPNATSSIVIGNDPINAGRDVDGRIDEIRWTYNVARYTANYTPSSTPFPDS